MYENSPRIGIIGVGSMGGAILSRLAGENRFTLGMRNRSRSAADEICDRFPGRVAVYETNRELADRSDLLIIAVKPNGFGGVCAELRGNVPRVVVSVAAGISLEELRGLFAGSSPEIVRCMPNTPGLIGEGLTAVVPAENASEETVRIVRDIFGLLGETVLISEKQMDGFTALCGSGPAYVALFAEALADGGVREGLPRALAVRMALKTLRGSAQLMLEHNLDPPELKNRTASPSGTTIEAVAALERAGFRSGVIEAVRAAAARSRSPGE